MKEKKVNNTKKVKPNKPFLTDKTHGK